MALNVEYAEHNLGMKVEGDLGDLQIIEEGSDSDDDNTPGGYLEDPDTTKGVGTLSAFPTGVQSSAAPVFGSVAVTKSENVQFGNNTYFHGPVTIKQIIHTNSGIDNSAYNNTEDDIKPDNKYHSKEESCKFLILDQINLKIKVGVHSSSKTSLASNHFSKPKTDRYCWFGSPGLPGFKKSLIDIMV